MKIKGILKSHYQENCFVDVVFEDESDEENYYIQKYDSNKISFISYKRDCSEIQSVDYKNEKNIKVELIYAFVKNDKSILVGTINEIRKDLIKVLEDKNVLPMAKIEIADELQFWGLADEYYSKSLDYLSKKRNNIRFLYSNKTTNNIVINDDKVIGAVIPKIIDFYKVVVESKDNSICWKDTIIIKNTIMLSFGNITTSTDLFTKKIKELNENNLLKDTIAKGASARSFYIENRLSEIGEADDNGSNNIKDIAAFIKERPHG